MLKLKNVALVVLISSVSSAAIASGSFSGGGNIGYQNSYNLGKSVFHKNVVCDTCIMGDQTFQRKDAKSTIAKLKTDKTFLSNVKGRKRTALINYLSRRYNAK